MIGTCLCRPEVKLRWEGIGTGGNHRAPVCRSPLFDGPKAGWWRYNCVMEIVLNGETRELAEGATVAELLVVTGMTQRKVAVEVNCEIVPHSRHGGHRLEAGDRVEIVHAIGGG